jgi:hypothetical protein
VILKGEKIKWEVPKLEYLGCGLSRGCVPCYEGNDANPEPQKKNCRDGNNATHKCEYGGGI